jgi:hypothetical protein
MSAMPDNFKVKVKKNLIGEYISLVVSAPSLSHSASLQKI